MLYEINNEYLTVKIKSLGAELSSLHDNESIEYIWQGDENYWGRQSPILFPMVGKLINDTTYFDGTIYKIPLHGFIRDNEFNLVTKTGNSITLECKSNEEMLQKYPFEFNFSVTYTLRGKSLIQSFCIKNYSFKTMPFALGGHTGFNCPIFKGDKFKDYTIEFIKRDKPLDSRLSDVQKRFIVKEEDFNLNYPKFSNGVFIFENIEAKGLKFVNSKNNKGIRVDYDGFNLLGIWTPEQINSPFICIEPWIGMSNKETNKPIEFKENTALAFIPPKEEFTRLYSVTII